MKKNLLLFFLLVACPVVFAQTDPFVKSAKNRQPNDSTLQYKGFGEFSGDTLAYLRYNFAKRSPDLYAGMTVQEFIDILPFPVVRVSVVDIDWIGYSNGDFPAAALYFSYEDIKNEIDGKRARLFIEVGLAPPFTREKDRHIRSYNSYYYDEAIRDSLKNTKITYAMVDDWRLDVYKEVRENRKKRMEDAVNTEATKPD